MRSWREPSVETAAQAEVLRRRHGMPRAVAFSYARRGLQDPGSFEAFINPRLAGLGDPGSIHAIESAVARTWDSIDRGDVIFVHGDYDVDGITGSAFLTRNLRALGAEVVAFVPHRKHGYGLGEAGISEALRAQAKLFITVDCGMTAHQEIAELHGHGVDVIVLDHHQAAETLPDAFAVVNPRLNDAIEQFGSLAAVGVAAKFVHAMAKVRPGALPPEVYKETLQLVALGTVADVVPLLAENRIFVSYGLKRLGRSQLPGVQALKVMARLTRPNLKAEDIAFQIAPRINAIGRMGDAGDALKLLLADDFDEAYKIAERIEGMNKERRKADQRVVREVLAEIKKRDTIPAAIVAWSENWHMGVVGIAASRLVDELNRPSFVIALDAENGVARGSARGPRGFSLPKALDGCKDLLREYGGHAQAAGFSLAPENLDAFQERLQSITENAELTTDDDPWEIDAHVSLEELDANCIDWIERLEPFGQGNPEPLFALKGVRMDGDPGVVAKKHLKFTLKDKTGRPLRAIAFRQGGRINEFTQHHKIDALVHASFDTWRGGRQIQLRVRELRSVES